VGGEKGCGGKVGREERWSGAFYAPSSVIPDTCFLFLCIFV